MKCVVPYHKHTVDVNGEPGGGETVVEVYYWFCSTERDVT
jgi:hypothetical protein